MMTVNIEAQKQKLTAEQSEIEAELSKIGFKLNGEGWETKPIEGETEMEFRDEQADEMEDMEERQATKSTLVARLNNITRALQKIAAGNYGQCEISGEEIEADRLAANPAARTCKQHLDQEDTL